MHSYQGLRFKRGFTTKGLRFTWQSLFLSMVRFQFRDHRLALDSLGLEFNLEASAIKAS